MTALVALLVVLCLAVIVGAIASVYFFAKALIAFGRYELDAGERALKMQALIDARVEARVGWASLPTQGQRTSSAGSRPIPEQPPAPNVRTTSRVDEIHELERESSRVTSPDADYDKRDGFAAQPLSHEVEL